MVSVSVGIHHFLEDLLDSYFWIEPLAYIEEVKKWERREFIYLIEAWIAKFLSFLCCLFLLIIN